VPPDHPQPLWPLGRSIVPRISARRPVPGAGPHPRRVVSHGRPGRHDAHRPSPGSGRGNAKARAVTAHRAGSRRPRWPDVRPRVRDRRPETL